MNKIYNSNTKILTKENKELFWVSQEKNFEIYEHINTKDGNFSCLADKKWICSRYAPLKEARSFVESQNINKGDLVVLYGIGLGYHIQPILDIIGDDGFLYCIETNLKLLRTAFSLIDLQKELSDFRFKLIIGRDNEELAKAFDEYILWNLETIPQDKIRIIFHEPSFKIIPPQFNWIQNSLELIKFDREGDTFFIDLMKQNIIKNIGVILKSADSKNLHNFFKDYPVLFIGAGPSLDKSIKQIQSIKEKVIIVCVDTAFIPLQSHNIRPDLIISIDPQEKSFHNFKSLEKEDIPILILPTSASMVVNNTKALKIVAMQAGSWASSFFENKLDSIGLTYGGSSVSVIGSDIVLNHAKGDIIFAGMDFSFPGMKAYSNYSPEFNNWFNKTTPYYTMEMASIENIYSRKTIFIENNMGAQIPTFQSMYRYVRALESVIDFHKRDNIYILNPLGAKIKGTTPIMFEEELNNLIPDIILDKTFSFNIMKFNSGLKNFCKEKILELKSIISNH